MTVLHVELTADVRAEIRTLLARNGIELDEEVEPSEGDLAPTELDTG